MARAPSFAFERRERQKAKAAKRADKTKVKADRKAGDADADDGSKTAQEAIDQMDVAIAADKIQK